MKMKKVIATFLAGILLINNTSLVFANSAIESWIFEGGKVAGISFTDGNCPIEVKSEHLTFDATTFPEKSYGSRELFLEYTGAVTAEYEFYNPTEETIKATLLFPFGTIPYYAYDNMHNRDDERFDILINGEPIEKETHYSYIGYDENFNTEEQLKRISNEYLEDAFYKPDLPVTKYSLKVYDAPKDIIAKYELSEAEKGIKIYSEYAEKEKNDIELYFYERKSATIYTFGQELSNPEKWKLYDGENSEKEAGGVLQLYETETMTLAEYINSQQKLSVVSDVDWYNIYVSRMKECEAYEENLYYMDEFDYWSLMQWYKYELEIAPGETLTNTVIAPLYPTINEEHEPPKYEYIYYLSPAKAWNKFENLEIQINTSRYLLDSSLEGFEQNENGYVLKSKTLPEEELTFTLCEEETTKKARHGRQGLDALVYMGWMLLPLWWVPVIIIGLIVFFKIKNKKGK